MTSIQLPYGRGHLCFNLPEERLAGIIESRLDTYVPQGTPEELVARSMEEPIGTPRLEELAKGKENVVLLCSDHTRPVPSCAIVPQMPSAGEILRLRSRFSSPQAATGAPHPRSWKKNSALRSQHGRRS